MNPTIISLEEYESKNIIIDNEDWEKLDRSNKYYEVNYQKKINPIEIEITIKAKYFIGLLSISPKLELIIRPKIKAADFIGLLLYVDSKRIKTWQILLNCIDKEKNFIDFFLGLFLKEVNNLLIKESKKGYNLVIQNRIQPKGKILLNNTIKSKRFLSNQITCQYFEFNLNTPYNQIIKYTLNYIRSLISIENLYIFRQNLNILKNVDNRKFISKEIESLSYDRLTFNYKPVHDLCKLILDDFSLKFQKGKDRFFAFVINSWNVYEIFLREIFNKFQSNFKINPYKISTITDDIDWDNKSILSRRPDIILTEKGEDKIIIDAKYKIKMETKDYDQINTYLTQHPLKLPYGELIYPKIFSVQKEEIIGTHEKVKIRYIDLSKASDPDYLKLFVHQTYQEFIKHKK